MARQLVPSRRRFIGTAAMTLASAQLGAFERNRGGSSGPSREIAAIGRGTQWLNSPPLTADRLTGKVVLVDFCTYTCINWLRTLPYIRAWAQRYGRELTVVGVHTPEFPFERDLENVSRALKQLRVEHAIVLDSDYAIWRAFDNRYWPALYLIDGRGRVGHRHFGEGEYAASERAIQRLLGAAGASPADGLVSVDGRGFEAAADWANLRSPEAYVGYERAEGFASPEAARRDRSRTYRPRPRLALNQWSLAGDWTIGRQATTLNTPRGQIVHRFHARDAHLVMRPSRPGAAVGFRVWLDGQPPGHAHGLDVDSEGNGTLNEPRLYQLLRQPGAIVDRTLTIEFLDAGVEAYSFTFG